VRYFNSPIIIFITLIIVLLVHIAPVSTIVTAQSINTGRIAGVVISEDINNVPGARVTLHSCIYNSITKEYTNTGLASIPENVTYTTGSPGEIPGLFIFDDVPSGLYNITAEKDGYKGYTIIEFNAKRQLMTADIVIPGYKISAPLPTPIPSPTPSIQLPEGFNPTTAALMAVLLVIAGALFLFRKKK
jgi:hypothetical protein